MKNTFHAAFYCALVIFICSAFSLNISAVEPNDSITFLEKEPLMDGVIYNDLLDLPVRYFEYLQKTNDSVYSPKANYRLAYGMSFFYIMVEIDCDSITFRDRAYQNGDGLIITIAKPKPDNKPADEFYVLGFSPGDNLNNIKAKKFIWYRNIDLSFLQLKESKFCATVINNKTYFQALVYWKEIYPFHPALEEGIGFNFCLVKAGAGNEKIYHLSVLDYNLQSEQSKRQYEILKFQKPSILEAPQLYCMLNRNSLTKKGELDLITFCIGKPKCIVNLNITIKGEDSPYYQTNDFSVYNEKGCTKLYFNLPVEKLASGNYILHWTDGSNSRGDIKFTVIPEFNYEKLINDYNMYYGKISTGSCNTIRFLLEDTKSRFDLLKNYEPCPVMLNDITDIIAFTKKAHAGQDSIYKREGVFRRGFLSLFDDTYRPYTIRIPENFKRDQKYPLLVYLHGSGDDDRAAFKMNPVTEGNFIELYPNGRGTSNVYCTNEAQADITEAINDVINNYPIDTSKIIIAGFSMGGYGAYRTYFENSQRLKGIAVFSGHPDLANKWLGSGYPNFLDKKTCEAFKNTKIFIFHGTEDLNCPFGLTLKLAEMLDSAGAEIEFVQEETGHSAPSNETIKKFWAWLDKIIYLKPD